MISSFYLNLGSVVIAAFFLLCEEAFSQEANNPILEDKLHSLIVNRFDFENSNVEDALIFLTTKSKELDPEHQGFLFVLERPKNANAIPNYNNKINITVDKMPIDDILTLMCTQAHLLYDVKKNGTIAFYSVSSQVFRKMTDTSKSITFTHILSWMGWNGYLDHDKTIVVLDNKSLGSLLEMNDKLNAVSVGPQDNIKIMIPESVSAFDTKHRPVYSFGNFLGNWRTKGAKIYFFQGNRKFILHTLTWSQYRKSSGQWKEDLTTAHLILDNHDIGKIDDAIRKLKETLWEKDALLQLVPPYAEAPMPQLIIPEGLLDLLDNLSERHSLAVEVLPFSD